MCQRVSVFIATIAHRIKETCRMVIVPAAWKLLASPTSLVAVFYISITVFVGSTRVYTEIGRGLPLLRSSNDCFFFRNSQKMYFNVSNFRTISLLLLQSSWASLFRKWLIVGFCRTPTPLHLRTERYPISWNIVFCPDFWTVVTIR